MIDSIIEYFQVWIKDVRFNNRSFVVVGCCCCFEEKKSCRLLSLHLTRQRIYFSYIEIAARSYLLEKSPEVLGGKVGTRMFDNCSFVIDVVVVVVVVSKTLLVSVAIFFFVFSLRIGSEAKK